MEALQQYSSEIANEGKQYFYSAESKVGQAKSGMLFKKGGIAVNYDEERIGTMKRAAEYEREFEKSLDNAAVHLKTATNYYHTFNSQYNEKRYKEAKSTHNEYKAHVQDVNRYLEIALTLCEARLFIAESESHEKDREENEQSMKYLHEFETHTNEAVFHHKEATRYYMTLLSGWIDAGDMKECSTFYTQYKRHIEEVTRHVEEAIKHCEVYVGKMPSEKEKQFKNDGKCVDQERSMFLIYRISGKLNKDLL